jgi:hypothetical protein
VREEVITENGERPVAILHAAEPVCRSISECIALAKAHEEETCKAPVLDPDFAEDFGRNYHPPQALEPARVGIVLDLSVIQL